MCLIQEAEDRLRTLRNKLKEERRQIIDDRRQLQLAAERIVMGRPILTLDPKRHITSKVMSSPLPADHELTFFRQRFSLFRHRMHFFSPQPIFYPLFLNEDDRIKKNRLSKLHHRV
jgi:hypothetical protein